VCLTARHAALALVLAGCSDGGGDTGLFVTVRGASVTGLQVRVARSQCGTWTQRDIPAGAAAFDNGRDLDKDPWSVLVVPPNQSESQEILAIEAIGYQGGTVVATGYLAPVHMVASEVRPLTLVLSAIGPEEFKLTERCFCHNGLPWLTVAENPDCTAAFPPVAPVEPGCPGIQPVKRPPACDGIAGPAETPGRTLPCFATTEAGCRAGRRTCLDQSGIAWSAGCAPEPTWSAAAELCDLYAKASTLACQDPIATLAAKVPQSQRVPPTRCGVTRGFVEPLNGVLLAALPLGRDTDAAPNLVQFASGGDPVSVTADPIGSPINLVITGDPPAKFQVPVLVQEVAGNLGQQITLRTYTFTTSPCVGGAADGGLPVDAS
jgi:hypothetical protein